MPARSLDEQVDDCSRAKKPRGAKRNDYSNLCAKGNISKAAVFRMPNPPQGVLHRVPVGALRRLQHALPGQALVHADLDRAVLERHQELLRERCDYTTTG